MATETFLVLSALGPDRPGLVAEVTEYLTDRGVKGRETPGPLDGLHPDALVKGVRVAIGNALVDDLDWLAPAAAGAALYELASALPIGPEQRDLGRRVLTQLSMQSPRTHRCDSLICRYAYVTNFRESFNCQFHTVVVADF